MPLRTSLLLLLPCVFIITVVSLDVPTTVSPYKILKSNLTDLLEVISAPDKLANDLLANNLIGASLQKEVLTTPNLSQYAKASKLVNKVLHSLETFDDCKTLVKFCDILKKQDDPDLCRIANTMIRELGMNYINNLLKVYILLFRFC